MVSMEEFESPPPEIAIMRIIDMVGSPDEIWISQATMRRTPRGGRTYTHLSVISSKGLTISNMVDRVMEVCIKHSNEKSNLFRISADKFRICNGCKVRKSKKVHIRIEE